jgi:hypothetical protein
VGHEIHGGCVMQVVNERRRMLRSRLSGGQRDALQVPAEHVERAMLVISGEIEVAGQTGTFGESQFVVFQTGAEIILQARGCAHLMLVGGEPFPEQASRLLELRVELQGPDRAQGCRLDSEGGETHIAGAISAPAADHATDTCDRSVNR